MSVAEVFYRVHIFSAIEAHKQFGGEWIRDPDLSDKPIPEQVNDFLLKNSARVVFVSAPDIRLLKSTDTERTRTFVISLSIIYTSTEIVHVEYPEKATEASISQIEKLFGSAIIPKTVFSAGTTSVAEQRLSPKQKEGEKSEEGDTRKESIQQRKQTTEGSILPSSGSYRSTTRAIRIPTPKGRNS